MAQGEETHPGRRRIWHLLPDVLVVVLVLLSLGQVRFDLAGRVGLEAASPVSDPAAVLPPEGLDLPPVQAALEVAPVDTPTAADPGRVARAVRRYAASPDLGRHVTVAVADVATGRVVYSHGSGTITPASTLKLLTTTAALEALGPTARFETTVRLQGDSLVLVGGGDPFLMSTAAKAKDTYPRRSTLQQLASQTAARLAAQGVRTVRLSYDDSLFDGPRVSPDWPDTYLPEDVVPPISPLWSDEGEAPHVGFVSDPTRTAVDTFAHLLAQRRIRVVGTPARGKAPQTATLVARVTSAPLDEIVERTLEVSDNQAAEVLAHHVGRAVLGDASFAGGVQGVRQVAGTLGISLQGAHLYDGSGLSRKNRVSPRTLLDVLRVAASPEHPELRAVITGLPVAGYTGSLEKRFAEAPLAAKGMVRAKTGTLTGVHGLAGLARDRSGAELVFVAIADRVPVPKTLAARKDLDELAAALGACACGPPT